MYCVNCKAEIGNNNFCPKCGTPIQSQQNGMSLPRGVACDTNGVIRWLWKERDFTRYFFMDTSRVGYKYVQNKKEETVASAFKELVKSGIDLAASNIAMDSEAYAGQDLPWEASGEGIGSAYLTFSYIKKVKRNPKKCEIKLKESISSLTIQMTSEQYPFIVDYIIQHAPNAKVK